MNNKKISLSLKISILVMIISLFGIATLAYVSFSLSKAIFAEHTAQILAKNIDQYGANIQENLSKLKYNFMIFSYNPSVEGFMRAYSSKYKYDKKTNKTFSQYKGDIKAITSLMMKQNPAYFQMRILDAKNGMEILKLIRQKDYIVNVPKNLLQNKWEKAYMQVPLQLQDDEVYISQINLNKEFGTIEYPVKPTIRVAKAITANDEKLGVAVINANVAELFDFQHLRNIKDTHTYIANQEGYYLFNHQDLDKVFGFEFGKDYRIIYDFPMLKNFINSKEQEFSCIDANDDLIMEARKVYITPKRYIIILQITTTSAFESKSYEYAKNLIVGVLLITLIITLVTTVLVNKLTKPIRKLTALADKISKSKGEEYVDIDVETNDEIGELARTFKIMIEVLDVSKKDLESFAQRLEEEVEVKTQELQRINENLQKMVEEKLRELREKDKALVQQSKMAAMGEMMGAIAHQWRQPLNSLAINIQILEDIAEDGEIDEKFIEKFVQKNMETIHFMSHTIDDFRNFFRKDKEKVRFGTSEAIETTLNLQKAQLKNHNITVQSDLKPAYIKGFKNEFMQTILNIISNAKDAIEERRNRTKKNFEGKIIISNELKDEYAIIRIEDNGGGISKEVAERIFEPYFTTKEEGKGTGMGLYMVKEIIERMNGSIDYKLTDDGTVFEIKLRLDNES